jgi:hypothetical protein
MKIGFMRVDLFTLYWLQGVRIAPSVVATNRQSVCISILGQALKRVDQHRPITRSNSQAVYKHENVHNS